MQYSDNQCNNNAMQLDLCYSMSIISILSSPAIPTRLHVWRGLNTLPNTFFMIFVSAMGAKPMDRIFVGYKNNTI